MLIPDCNKREDVICYLKFDKLSFLESIDKFYINRDCGCHNQQIVSFKPSENFGFLGTWVSMCNIFNFIFYC